MSFSKYTALTANEVLGEFITFSDSGLKTSDIKVLSSRYGKNVLKFDEVRWWNILFRQFKSAFVYLLVVAALIAIILGERLDAAMILLFITINTLLGFTQEYKSEKTLKLLKKFLVRKSEVLRDDKKTIIDTADLVPGDIVFIQTGNLVPADLRLISEKELNIDESSLTGETLPVKKIIGKLKSPTEQPYKALNIAFSGTSVTRGEGIGVVVSIGKESEIGKIAKLAIDSESESSFEKQISKFSKFTLILTVVTLLLVFIVHAVFKQGQISIPEFAIFSIALAVGVIPEALPVVTTFSLTRGAHKLSKKSVVVKRLSAIEDLGSIQVLCCDKTGTLTQNEMTISQINSENTNLTLFYAAIASNTLANDKGKDSFDKAIFKYINGEIKDKVKEIEIISDLPFSPDRKRNSVLASINNKKVLIVRGAQESVLSQIKNFDKTKVKDLIKWILSEGSLGKRVIAVGCKRFDNINYTEEDECGDLEFVGLISFNDQIKESAYEAVRKAEKLGVRIKILTGDSSEVSGTVAKEVGIVTKRSDVITGEDFELLLPSDQVEAVEKYDVFARVSPIQKYKIIQLLKNKFEVGFLGDGINDAPALKIANVAIVVDSAADISIEVSDIILLKQNLQVIVDGIEEGRKTFINTVKYIKSTLASNFGNFYAMAFASLILDFLPMLPIQILLVNLLSDFPMISVATDTVEDEELRNPGTYNVKSITLIATILGITSTLFDFIMFGAFYKLGPKILQTNWFIGSILTELLLIFSIRTMKPFFKASKAPSKTIFALTFIAAFFTITIPFTDMGRNIFGFIKPSFTQLYIVLVIAGLYFAATEMVKYFYVRFLDYER